MDESKIGMKVKSIIRMLVLAIVTAFFISGVAKTIYHDSSKQVPTYPRTIIEARVVSIDKDKVATIETKDGNLWQWTEAPDTLTSGKDVELTFAGDYNPSKESGTIIYVRYICDGQWVTLQ